MDKDSVCLGDQEETGVNIFIQNILQELQHTMLYTELKCAAQTLATSTSCESGNLKQEVMNGLSESGWEKMLHNEIYRRLLQRPSSQENLPEATAEHKKEPIGYIRKAQSSWEKKVLKSLNSMCTELSVPLARKRAIPEQKEIRLLWNELSVDEQDLSSFRPVYGPKDLLDMLTMVKNPNVTAGGPSQLPASWGLIQVPLKVKTMEELRQHFREIHPRFPQVGVDDCVDVVGEHFENERIKLGERVASIDNMAIAQKYARRGVPPALRAQLWGQILGVKITNTDKLYYDQLRAHVFKHHLLLDKLIYKDVKLTATNDDQYFVFEDYLHQVLLLFSRDTQILKHFNHSSATPPKSFIRGMLGVEEYAVVYPPNGIVPFHGFAMYAAPLCFVYDDPILLYFTFREIYTRLLFRLHTISSHPQGIVSVCVLFENLLQSHQPRLFYYLRQMGAHPLRLAFKWLMRAFSGFLASDQLLLLWDRILAYNSLEPLAILAASIFAFRRLNLMETSSFAAADAVLADITTIKIIPLMQLFMFPNVS